MVLRPLLTHLDIGFHADAILFVPREAATTSNVPERLRRLQLGP